MNIAHPITIIPPPIKKADGSTKTFDPITLNELDIVLTDNPKLQTTSVRIFPCPKPLVLWKGEAYVAAGDWTQAQAEARITELLGYSPATVLQGLFQ